MEATTDAAIHHQLNASLLGRCVLAMASGYDEAIEPKFPDSAILAMAGVFEHLAAEVTVLTQTEPELTAMEFAQKLLAEIDPSLNDVPEDELEEDHACPWLNDPSLTAEERNHR